MLNKNRIVIDVRLLGRGRNSGIPEYTRELVDHFLSADSSNEFILFYPGWKKHPLPEKWRRHPRVSVYNLRTPNKLLDFSARFFQIPTLDTLIKSEVIFSPHFNNLITRKIPRVITFHDLSFLHHPDFFSARQRIWHWLQHYRKQATEASHIIAVSEFTKSDLINYLGVPENKISVIYSGVNEIFKPLPEPEIREFQRKNNLEFPFILYLGTIEPRKNIEAIIRAFTIIKERSEFRSMRLVLAGQPGWLHKNVARAAKQSPFRDQIIFRAQIENRDRVFLYNAARVFVFPSFFEGFGFPPLEAQASGTPVIASDRTSLPEILNNSAYLINPWRVDELAVKLTTLLSSPTEQKRLRVEGIKNARRFEWQKTAQATLSILDHVKKSY
jgi:glycosyltransferase involved in cell wall biosynthesis